MHRSIEIGDYVTFVQSPYPYTVGLVKSIYDTLLYIEWLVAPDVGVSNYTCICGEGIVYGPYSVNHLKSITLEDTLLLLLATRN